MLRTKWSRVDSIEYDKKREIQKEEKQRERETGRKKTEKERENVDRRVV